VFSKVTAYVLVNQDSFPDRGIDFSLGFHAQTGSKNYAASYPVSVRAYSSEIKQLESEINHSSPCNTKVKNV
jgi:hypothetical protein